MALYRLSYARVSTAEQSLEVQQAQFEVFGYDEIFVEKLSGRRRDRPEFARLIDRALELRAQGQDVQVLVIEWSRWARDTAFSLEAVERLERAGVQILETTTGQPITLKDSSGLLNVGIKSLMAHHYSVELSGRISRSYEHRRKLGKPMAGPVPWGYQRTTNNAALEPSPDWAFCREVIQRYLGGTTYVELSSWLLAEHGIKKSDAGLRVWMTSPILRGHLAYKDRAEILYNTHPALITEQEWRAIQRRMRVNRQLRGRNKGRVYAIDASLLKCAICGGQVHCASNHHDRYFCCYQSKKRGLCNAPRKYLREDWVEAAIQEALAETSEALAEAVLVAESEPSIDPRAVALEAELDQLRDMAHRPSIAAAIAEIEAELAQLKTAPAIVEAEAVERRELIQGLAQLGPEDWAELSPPDRREIYCDLVERVVVRGREIIEVVLRV